MSIVTGLKSDGLDSNKSDRKSPKRTVIRPSSGIAVLNLRELWDYRDLLVVFAQRDVKLRYRQTALGVVWVVIQPLLAAGIFSFVFGKIGKFPSDGLPYFLFSYAGLLAWNAFSTTLTKVSNCLLGNSQLVSKIYFPRLVLPLSTVFGTMIDFSVGLAMMAVLLVAYHVPLTIGVCLLPLWTLLVVMLAVGIGLITSSLSVSYRDVQYVLPVIVQFLLYASPVAYSLSAVPHHLRFVVLANPLAALLEAFRWSLLGHGHINQAALAYSAITVMAVFVAGAYAFRSMERKFADVI